MATIPALPGMMLPLSAQRGNSQLQVRKCFAEQLRVQKDILIMESKLKEVIRILHLKLKETVRYNDQKLWQ